MLKTYKYRLQPTKRQEKVLEAQLEECWWLYNFMLEDRILSYELEGKSQTYYTQAVYLPVLKKERKSLNTVHSQVLQNVVVRIDLAFKAFFRRCKIEGEKAGFPRFKGYGRYDSITYSQSGFSVVDDKVILSKIGHIKIRLHREIQGKIKTCTISRSSTGKWHACFSCEVEPKVLPVNAQAVGIDVGLHSFTTLSTGEKVAAPQFFRKEEKALAKAQRRKEKEAKGSKERKKRIKVESKIHERIKNRRENFSHQEARKIVNRFGIICVEDLQVNRMVHNHCLAKSISDVAWSAFFQKLESKAVEAGRQFIKVNPAYTSQDCSNCGHRQKMPLSERTYNCPCCKIEIDRDYNASLNILAVGLHSLGNQSLEAPQFIARE